MRTLVHITFRFFIFGLLSISLPLNALAQLSGTYVVNTSGSGNFSSISEAMDSLESQGVSSAVRIEIVSGTYTEQLRLGQVSGTSLTNTVLFTSQAGSSDSVEIQYPSSATYNYVMNLDSCKYIHFSNISFTSTGTGYGVVIDMKGPVRTLSFDSCVFNGLDTTATGGAYMIFKALYVYGDSGTVISNCTFNNGWRALTYAGHFSDRAENFELSNNTFNGFNASAAFLTGVDGLVANGNIIQSSTGTGGITATSASVCTLKNNLIELSQGDLGLNIYNSNGTSSSHNQVYNNSVSCDNTGKTEGIRVYNSDYTDLFFNSIYLGTQSNLNSAGLNIVNGSDNIQCLNNVVYSEGAGFALNHHGLNFSTFISDYNSFYGFGSGTFNIETGTHAGSYFDLAAWLAVGLDSNSVEVDPFFTTFGDLHASNAHLYAAGSTISGISLDFEGDSRGTPPCIGVDEFVSTPLVPLSGLYTIDPNGSGSRNYMNPASAFAALDTFGVDSIVIFELSSDTFYGQASLSRITGASSLNTVTFISAARHSDSTWWIDTLTSTASTNYLLNIDHADYVSFKLISLKKNTASYSTVVSLTGMATNITFDSCVIEGYTISSSAYEYDLIKSDGTFNCDNFAITNCTLLNGSNAIHFQGISSTNRTQGLTITNNTITDFGGIGFYILSVGNTIVQNNNMESGTAFYGIYLTGCREFNISNNQLEIRAGFRGMNLLSGGGYSGAPCIIANNTVSMRSTSTTYGIYLWQISHAEVHFNNVFIDSTSNSNSAPLFADYYSNVLNIRNNNFFNKGSGYAYRHDGVYTSNWSSDFNNLYTKGSNLVRVGTSYYGDLSAFQTSGKDSNSMTVNPKYTAFGDLHCSELELVSQGIAISGSTTDMDGQIRRTTPCIGADEFPTTDWLIESIISPVSSCAQDKEEVQIRVVNNGLENVDTLALAYQLSGGSMIYDSLFTSLSAGSSSLFSFSDSADLQGIDTLSLLAYCNNSNDENPNNDSAVVSYFPIAFSLLEDTNSCGGGTQLSVSDGIPTDTAVNGSDTTYSYQYLWASQDSGALILHPASEDQSQLSAGKYYVTITDKEACSVLDSITLSFALDSIPESSYSSTCAYRDSSGWTYALDSAGKVICGIFNVHPDSTTANLSVLPNDSIYSVFNHQYSGRVIEIDQGDTSGKTSFQIRLYYTKSEVQALISQSDSISDLSDLIIHKYNGPNQNTDIGDDSSSSTYWEQFIPVIDSTIHAYSFQITISSFSEFYLSYATDSVLNNPVPVEWLQFSAMPHETDVQLEWSTASEVNNSHFQIMRSINGTDWEDIAEIPGNGTTWNISQYEFTDVGILQKGPLWYYQIMQVDFDQQRSFSEIRRVYQQLNAFTIYPNPATGLINVNTSGIERIELYDLQGKLLYSQTADPSRNQHTVQLGHLSKGMYQIRLNQRGRVISKSVVVR